jgi:hypothetical protein
LEEVYVKRRERERGKKKKKRFVTKRGKVWKGVFQLNLFQPVGVTWWPPPARRLKCESYIAGTCQCILTLTLLTIESRVSILLYGMSDEKQVGVWRMIKTFIGSLKVIRFHGDCYSPFAVLSFCKSKSCLDSFAWSSITVSRNFKQRAHLPGLNTVRTWRIGVATQYFKPRLIEKRMDHPPWKVSLFVGYGFARKGDNIPHLKFYMKKAVLVIYRVMLRMLGFVGWMANFSATGISRCFGAMCDRQRSRQHRQTVILVPVDR